MKFSFDPTLINDGGLNQMRHELGDVLVAEPEKDSYLCDEEILAAIHGSKSWKRAKLRLVESLLFRFSYEVDTKVHEAEWKLSQRVDEWEKLRKRLQDEIEEEKVAVVFGFDAKFRRPPIFRIAQHDNRRF